ncbi:MAG: hypothetical protein U0V87_07085 [Acidobacteriota bacterium]
MNQTLRQTDEDIAVLSRRHLEAIVAIDSQSDERSHSIPSTEGQKALADWLAGFFDAQGCGTEVDALANVVASIPGRGVGASQAPLALMVHLDTSRGTQAVPALQHEPRWNGTRIPYPANERLWVDVENYPAAKEFIGQDILFGPGDAPFGLDDKLGLAHLMTLVVLLRTNPEIPHPPLLIVCRPDEEIGRMAAVEGVAELLRKKGVRRGFTIDGILPFEVNVENFNASQGSVVFADRPSELTHEPHSRLCRVFIGGVNTHGCTAKAEGFRAATRLAAELLERLRADSVFPARIVPLAFQSMPLRDCDAELTLAVGGESPEAACELWGVLRHALESVVGPHIKRGASFSIGEPEPLTSDAPKSRATCDMLQFVGEFLTSHPLRAGGRETREGAQGIPTRSALPVDGDQARHPPERFLARRLAAREETCPHPSPKTRPTATISTCRDDKSRLTAHPELLEWPRARRSGRDRVPHPADPGRTGVDPFLDRGIPVANLEPGYFCAGAGEEFTLAQMMSAHARWLAGLVAEIAQDNRGSAETLPRSGVHGRGAMELDSDAN